MTAFVIVCAVMLVVTLIWTTLPLWRPRPTVDVAATRGERRTSSIVVAVAVPVLAGAMYAYLSNWDWNKPATAAAQAASVESMMSQLEAKLAANPGDLQGWIMQGNIV